MENADINYQPPDENNVCFVKETLPCVNDHTTNTLDILMDK